MTGTDLKRIRINGELSQAEIARRAGVSRQRIFMLEQGRSDRSLANWAKILTAYGYKITPPANNMPAIYPAAKITKKMLSDWEQIDKTVRKYIAGEIEN